MSSSSPGSHFVMRWHWRFGGGRVADAHVFRIWVALRQVAADAVCCRRRGVQLKLVGVAHVNVRAHGVAGECAWRAAVLLVAARGTICARVVVLLVALCHRVLARRAGVAALTLRVLSRRARARLVAASGARRAL